MQIVRLTAENVMCLRAVEITPSGELVIIGGNNGNGKTSVLNAIYFALAGKSAMKNTPNLIRDGEESARVRLDLGEVVVTRTWTEAGTKVTVESSEGAQYKSPQKMLDALLGSLTFDPLAFSRMRPADQRDALLELVKLPFDLVKHDEKREAMFVERTGLNRDARNMKAQFEGMVTEDVDPSWILDSSVLVAQLEAAEAEHQAYRTREAKIASLTARIAEDELTIKQALEIISKAESHRDGLIDECMDVEREQEDVSQLPDMEPIRSEISEVDHRRAIVRDNSTREAIGEQASEASDIAKSATERIKAMDDKKAKALAKITMPIDGLEFGTEGVVYNGQPFSQASSAEALRVSAAIAMAGNPDLKVLRIQDGSLLDENSLQLLADLASEKGFQVWIEMVGQDEGMTVVMSDGMATPQ